MDEPPIIQEPQGFPLKFLLGFVGVLLLVGLGLGYYLYSRGALDLPFLTQTVAPPSVSPAPQPNIEYNFQPNCGTQADGVLVINAANVLENNRAITLRGTISKIELKDDTATLLLTSEGGERSVQFDFKDVPNLVFDSKTQQPLKVSELKFTDRILIDYNCNPKTNSAPVIVRIQRNNPS